MNIEQVIGVVATGGLGVAMVTGAFMYKYRKSETREKNVDTDIRIYKFIEEQRTIRENEIYELKEEVLKLKQLLGEKELENKQLANFIKGLEAKIKKMELHLERSQKEITKLQNAKTSKDA